MHRLRRWRWLALGLLPVAIYLGLILAAYIRPPLTINGGTTGGRELPMASVALDYKGRWPIWLMGVTVQGVLPPDEVGALRTKPMRIADFQALWDTQYLDAVGDLSGWRINPGEPYLSNAVVMTWYQKVDLRWLTCPVVRYRYLGWPMEAKGFCREWLRGAAVTDRLPPEAPTDWAEWRPSGTGFDYKTLRVKDDLWILVATGTEAAEGYLIFNQYTEEPGGGRAHLHLRFVTIPDEPANRMILIVPMRWGEPDPEVLVEVLPAAQLRR